MTSDKNTAPDHVKVLTGKELGEQIRQVCGGTNAILAVAFWGKNAFTNLGLNREDVKIVLDVSAGGTNPTEFDTMKSSLGKRLHVLNHLHAKLYASDAGAVITSANASDNGLNLKGAGLVEAGIYFPSGTAEAKSIRKMAKAFYADGHEASEEDLKQCRELWAKVPRSDDGLSNAGSGKIKFIDALKYHPSILKEYRFVLTKQTENSSKLIAQEWRTAQGEAQERGERIPAEFDSDEWEYFNWPFQDTPAGTEFISLHLDEKREIKAAVAIPNPPSERCTFAKLTSWKGRGFKFWADGYCMSFEDTGLASVIDQLCEIDNCEVSVWDIHKALKSS